MFCFDGDRAGRAAAWRALQQALPEAREGRELRFLFLPEGEDPDSLVGREGGERFEARLDSALPLSEYLVAQLGEQADVSHADGKAHFVALARPLLEKIAPGVYRELLLDRVAAALGTAGRARCSSGWRHRKPPAARTSAQRRQPRGAARRRCARSAAGSLMTQAITLAAAFPGRRRRGRRAAAAGAGATESAGRRRAAASCSSSCGASPAATMAQTLERWRDRPEYRRLCELAASEPLVPDAAAAGQELSQAVARLLDAELRRRLEVLIEKARAQTLDEAEKLELQALTLPKPGSAPR